MSKTLRIILAVVLGLLVVCALAVAAFLVVRTAPTLISQVPRALQPAQPAPPTAPQFPQRPFRQFPGNPFFSGPRRGVGGLGGFLGIGFFLFRLAIPLGLGALVILALFFLLRRPAQPLPAAPMSAGPAASALACPHCGRTVQADWVACPYCGERLQEAPPSE